MQIVTATAAKQSLAAVLDACLREPVMIQKQKRDVAVVLSIAEYERLSKVNVAEFFRFANDVGARAQRDGLTDARVEAMVRSD